MAINRLGAPRRRVLANAYTKLLVHVDFSARVRRIVIPSDARERLFAYMGGIARDNGIKALAVDDSDDHAHLPLQVPTTIATARAMKPITERFSKMDT